MAFDKKSRASRLDAVSHLIGVEQTLSSIILRLSGGYDNGTDDEVAPLLEARDHVATVISQLLAPVS